MSTLLWQTEHSKDVAGLVCRPQHQETFVLHDLERGHLAHLHRQESPAALEAQMEMSLGSWAANLLISQLTGKQPARPVRELPWGRLSDLS